LNIFTGDKEDENSSVLIELAANGKDKKDILYYKKLKHKYLFVGEEVYVFETDEPIIKYYSLIGNSDVTYPVALSKEKAYYMKDKICINRSEFPKGTDWKNSYTQFYDNEELAQEKFKNVKKLEKNPLNEAIEHRKLGEFGLDSGQAIIVDPAHLENCSKEIKNMLKGDFKSDEGKGTKSLGKYNTGLYLSLFGGDGTFDVYGVYDSNAEHSHMPYKLVIHVRHPDDFPKDIPLYESTSNYYPGYSDDGTSDHLSAIRDKTSPILNKELKKMEKNILDSGYPKNEQGKFWQKWMYANMITTSLQDGFFMEPDLIKKAIKYYKEVLDPEEIKNNSYGSKEFKPEVEETLKALEAEKPLGGGKNKKFYYAPGFMDKNQRKQANTKKDL